MQQKIEAFIKLSDLFKENGFSLFLVGGTVRDFLLKKELSDMDVATDATPVDIKNFLPDANYHYEQYGFVSCRIDNIKFDITTFRKEKAYKDSRHPTKIKFVKSMKVDYKRRDFTVNAMYADSRFVIYDFCKGEEDIKNRKLKFIGNPKKRIKEDPLRILRAIRFNLMYKLQIDEDLQKILKKYTYLLENLNRSKITEEISKIHVEDKMLVETVFKNYDIDKYLKEGKNNG